jgi:hypothetical protein
VTDGCYPGAMVRVVGVTGREQLVDREDVSRFGKAKGTLAAQRLEPAGRRPSLQLVGVAMSR